MVLLPRASIDHAPGRPQHWSTVDSDVGDWVNEIVSRVESSLSSVGVYLHGSLAMGSYFRPKSDVDLLVVVQDALSDADRRAVAIAVLAMFEGRPTIGGVELSVVQRRHVEAFQHPLPYEFHFSEKWVDDVRSGGAGPRGRDRDLAAHCMMTLRRGIALRGEDPHAAFGPVPDEAFVDSIIDDFQWIVDGGILESPFYGVLNLCRVLQVVAEGTHHPPSKEEGGEWALEHLPEDHYSTIHDALECYRSAADIPSDQRRMHGHAWNEEALIAIAGFARQRVDPAT